MKKLTILSNFSAILSRLLFFIALLGIFFAWCPENAFAQRGSIRLLAPQKTYAKGEEVTAYVYFFRVPSMFGFFSSLARYIGNSQDFQLVKRTRIFNYQEQLRDSQGFPIGEVEHALYRIRLKPLADKTSLSYGPIRYRGIVSNVLTFRRRTLLASQQHIRLQTLIRSKNFKVGQPFEMKTTVHCPQSLCDYSQIDMNSLIQHLQNKTQVAPSSALWLKKHHVLPEIRYDYSHKPPIVNISFVYHFYPLRGGTLQTPIVSISLPIIEIVDQGKIERQLREWLIQKQNFSVRNAERYISLRRKKVAFISFRELRTKRYPIQVQQDGVCRGEWKLSSRLVTPANTSLPLWEVSLKGKGFFLLADEALRKTLQDALKKAHLQEKLQLKHYRWRLPEQNLAGRGSIHFYFKFEGKQPNLPPLKMVFIAPSGKKYTQTTPPIPQGSRSTPLEDTFHYSPTDRHLYLYYEQKPTSDTPQMAHIWTYQLSSDFPVFHVLSRRWQIEAPLLLEQKSLRKNFVHRSSSNSGFGSFFQMTTRTVIIEAKVGKAPVRQRQGLLARFPIVQWGNQWVTFKEETGNGLTMSAALSRKSYFAGESVEYKLFIRCPTTECGQKSAGFYAQIFQAHLKLPGFDRFANLRILDRFTRTEKNNITTFLYRVRFRAPQTKKLHLKPATLRLPRHLLHRLYKKNNICFFRSGRAREVLLSSIAKDHYGQSGQQDCALGTQELSTLPFDVPIEPLPANAQDIKLIGSFAIKAYLEQLSFPNKQSTEVDKPFYLIVDISGEGDLYTAQEMLKDQLSSISRELDKQHVTAYIQDNDDKDLQKRGILRIQVQLIAEREGKITIPSLKLRYYHREEGILTAQTLPLSVTIEGRSNTSRSLHSFRPTQKKTIQQLQKETDLRANQILAHSPLNNEYFELREPKNLILLFFSPALFLLFLGWHQRRLKLLSDPKRLKQQRALKEFSRRIAKINPNDRWEHEFLLALQTFLADRLALEQKQPTPKEAEEILREHLPHSELTDEAKALVQSMQQLEDALYGGAPIENKTSFAKSLTQILKKLHHSLPDTKEPRS